MTDLTDLHANFRTNLSQEVRQPRSWTGRFLSAQPPAGLVVPGALALAGLITYIDIASSSDFRLALFYVVPVALCTWFAGRSAGYFIAVIVSVLWFVSGFRGDMHYTRPIFAYWNALFRLVCFISLAALLASMKELSLHLRELVDQRTASLRQLASQLAQAEQSERRQLAHDLHDGFSQLVSLLKLNLTAFSQARAPESADRQRIEEAIGMVDELMQRSRTLTFDLHPPMLEHLGLVPTLRRHGEQFRQQTHLEVIVNEEGRAWKLPAASANYLFRSIKELMNNAARHGQARQIIVSIYWLPGTLRIVIDDDGKGFDPQQVFAPNVSKGLGLAGIHERLLSLGGNMRLESNVGSGTRVVLELPGAAEEVLS